MRKEIKQKRLLNKVKISAKGLYDLIQTQKANNGLSLFGYQCKENRRIEIATYGHLYRESVLGHWIELK